jgi:hypothetical protein
MSARRIVLIVVAASLGGILVLALGIAGLVAIAGPHYLTGAQLAARPEAGLIYPNAVQLSMTTHDEMHPLFEGPSQASVIRSLRTSDPMPAVVAWYGMKLGALGYSELPGRPGQFAYWRKGNSYFSLVYERVTAGSPAPPGRSAFTTALTVTPGG